MREMLKANGKDLNGKTVLISGSGNVAIYAAQKAAEFGAKVVAMSDSNGCIYDANGINLDVIKKIKEVERKRIKEYLNYVPSATYYEDKDGFRNIWTIKADIALPCATQNEISLEAAKSLVDNGVWAVGEGANMPTTIEAINYLLEKGVLLAPAKAANAGGVATSALEMSQNSMRYSWTFDEVNAKLDSIMTNIFKSCKEAAEEYGFGNNYVAGANIAGFKKVADAMYAQGLI